MVVSHIKMHFVSECVSDFSTFFFTHSSLTFNANFRFVFLLLPLLLLASSATISNDICGAVIECKRWDNGGANAATTPLLVTAISTAMVSFMFLIYVCVDVFYIYVYIYMKCVERFDLCSVPRDQGKKRDGVSATNRKISPLHSTGTPFW